MLPGVASPSQDLRGEILGLVGENVLGTQLQTENFEMTTLRGAIKDSGAFDFTLQEGEQGDDHALDLHDDNHLNAKIRNKKCHQGTQIQFLCLPIDPDFTVHEPTEDKHL